MSWKQPIPTGLEKIFGEDYRAMQFYKELIYRANNTTQPVSINGTTITLERGQVIFGRNQYAKYLGWSSATVETVKQRILKKYTVCNIIRTTNKYSVFSLNSYDELVSYNTSDNNRTTSEHQQNNTSKTDKTVDSISTASVVLSDNENLNEINSLTSEDFLEIAQLFSISEQDVRKVHNDLKDFAEKGKLKHSISNGRKTLEKWVDKAVNKYHTIQPIKSMEEIVREQTGDPKVKVY